MTGDSICNSSNVFFDKIACLHKGEQALLSSTPKLKDDLDQPCQVINIGEIEKSDKSIARVQNFWSGRFRK